MARKVNYDEKIEALKKKIAKKEEELKSLKATLAEWKTKKAKGDYAELVEYMQTNKITAADVLAQIK